MSTDSPGANGSPQPIRPQYPPYQQPIPPPYYPYPPQKKHPQWLVLAVIVVVVLGLVAFLAFVYLDSSSNCTIEDYSASVNSYGNIAFDVSVWNHGSSPETITIRCSVDTFDGGFSYDRTVTIEPGSEQVRIYVNLPYGLADSATNAKCYIL